MLEPNKIKKIVNINYFLLLIRKFRQEDIEDSQHSFKRLSQRQREIFNIEEIRKILLKDRPFLVGIQENGNYAVFYKHLGKNLRIILRLENKKVKIVTFYYILDEQIPNL